MLIRTPLEAAAIGEELRRRVAQTDRQLPVVDLQTLGHRLTESVAKPRLDAVLLTCFAGVVAN